MQVAGARIAREAEVSAELEGMRALRPGEVIHQVVNWNSKILAIGESLVEADERVPLLIGVTHDAEALAGESVAEVVHHGSAEHGGVTDCETPAVIGHDRFGSGSAQEWLGRVIDVLQVATPEQSVLAGGVEVIVESGNEGGVIQLDRSAEAVAGIVQAVTNGKVVGDQVSESLIEVVEHDGIGSGAGRIDAGDIGGT